MLKKITVFFIFCLVTFVVPIAAAAPFNPINKAIDNTGLGQDSIISVSVKDIESNDTVFSRHRNTYLNPASSLKIFTMAAALDTLGEKYNFETIVYIDKNKNLYLKLGADPLFSSKDLDTLVKTLKKAYTGKIKNFYIDDSVIDKVYYPDGWTVDDFWPNSPKISPYIIDNNTITVNFYIIKEKNDIKISQKNDYKFSFINELQISDKTEIIPSLNYGENSGIVSLRGTISGDLSKDFPVLDTTQFFTCKLRKALDNNGISYSKPFYQKKAPNDAKRIASFRRPIKEVLSFILKTSDNFSAEVVFKLAGGIWVKNRDEYIKKAYQTDNKAISPAASGSLGTLNNGKEMFFDYYKKAGLLTNDDKINLSDASGVSRYNTMTTSWMTNALCFLSKNSSIKNYMMTSNEGTLSRRMKDLEGNLRAKTGTIFGVSSLTGYLTSKNNKNYAFSIIIQNFGVRPSVVKGLEDDIVYGIYSLE